jgi:hypothetical protein
VTFVEKKRLLQKQEIGDIQSQKPMNKDTISDKIIGYLAILILIFAIILPLVLVALAVISNQFRT